jgi:hypothetical protein
LSHRAASAHPAVQKENRAEMIEIDTSRRSFPQVGAVRLSVGAVAQSCRTAYAPVVPDVEELTVTDSTGTSLRRWPVDARGFLN